MTTKTKKEGKQVGRDKKNLAAEEPSVGEPDPRKLSDEEMAEIEAHADEAVKDLIEAEGSEEMVVADEITNVGIQDQKTVSSGIELLQERMGNVFYSDNKKGVAEDMSKDIRKLQNTLAKVNPEDIKKEAKYRIIRIIPFFGNWIVNVLKTASDRRLTLQDFIEHLEDSLQAGETMLRQDNAQLLVMYQDIEGKQKTIGADAYFAETLAKKLKAAIDTTDDKKKKGTLNKVLFRVASRAQDLRAMENVHEQFFVSIEMTRDDNDMLIQTVRRMLSMGMNVVYIAFAIHAALVRQANVIEAERGTRDFLGNMILNNATMINHHVKEIGDLYKEPIIALDKLEKAIDQLEIAIEETNKLKAEGVVKALDNVEKLKELTQEVKEKAGQLATGEVKSLEASKTLKQLPAGRKPQS